MSRMKDVIIDIQDELVSGRLSWQEIAYRCNVPLHWVQEAAEQLEREQLESNYDESMDGDHATALASAGFGTDEDYGYACEEF